MEDSVTELFVTITVVVAFIVFFLRRRLLRHHNYVKKIAETTLDRTNPNNYAEPYIRKCLIVINARFKEDLSIDDVSKVLHITSAHLQQVLLDHTNRSFVAHLNDARVTHSKKVLLSTDKPITEVAQLVGYSNPNYYIRLFKHEYGMSPDKFRIKFR